jgi:serine/threonine protein kinase
MPFRFSVVAGADEGRLFALPDDGEVVVGSSHKNCDICLNDLRASRTHCTVEVRDGQVKVADMGEGHGTFVNNAQVQERVLMPGDTLRVGGTTLKLEDGAMIAQDDVVEDLEVVEEENKPPLPLDHLHELTGETLKHYELGEVLGKGHCGVVFLARDAKRDQMVALKVLAPQFPDNDEEFSHFVEVAKQLLPLKHPNLTRLLGVGRSGYYLWQAWDYIEGEDLATTIKRLSKADKIEWKKALRLAVHGARALEYAHEHDLVHGAVTPANIIARAADKTVKLCDVMMAQAMEGSLLYRHRHSARMATDLPYLSPEQCPVISPRYDDLSDIYSLGAVTYARLTGHAPCEGKSQDEIRTKIRTVIPVKPRKLQSGIPEAFEAVVMRMLAKKPEDRFASASQVVEQLEPLADDYDVEV